MIAIHSTPNPNALKFVVNEKWINFVWECVDEKDAAKSILAKKLWDLGVAYIMFGYDFVSVIKKNEQKWDDLEQEIVGIIGNFLKQDIGLFENADENLGKDVESMREESMNEQSISEKNLGEEQKFAEEFPQEFSKLEMQIIATLEEKVQPIVQMHGGVVKFIKFDDGVVVLDLQGACRGCPSSSITLKNGIQNLLCYYFPEVKEVVNA